MPGFEDLLNRFERIVSELCRSQSTFANYSRHVAVISLYFGKIPTELDSEQVHDYLFFLQNNPKHLPKRISSTAFTDFDFCLNPKVCDAYFAQTFCENKALRLFEQHPETAKTENVAEKNACDGVCKISKDNTCQKRPLFQNRQLTYHSDF